MYLARAWRDEAPAAAKTARTSQTPHLLPAAPGYEAIIAGSCAEATRAQLDYFEASHPVYRIDLLAPAEHFETELKNWAKSRLEEGPIAVATSADVEEVKRIQTELGVKGAAQLADKLLGKAAMILRHLGARKFMVAGGETSGQVFASLGIAHVQVAPFDNLSGGYCHQAGPEPMSFVLKAGALGGQDFMFTALERMREADANE